MAAAPNPFHQHARQWLIRVNIGREAVEAMEAALADVALSLTSFETAPDSSDWYVEALSAVPPADAEIQSRLALAAGFANIPTPRFTIRELVAKDWVSEVQKNFPPFRVGRFYVHGSHISEIPRALISLRVDAGAAFGSGEHATTFGCLLALSRLARAQKFRRPLDMGCGSGILAIAAAKLWRRQTIGIDIDPVSIMVARENAASNKVSALTTFAVGDGYRSSQVRGAGTFDLIVANILARPLVRMAPDLARRLAPGGFAVLSGLLAGQERMVLAAHRLQGLKLVGRICREGWSTLIIERGRT